MKTKECSRCRQFKDVDQFGANSNSTDGLSLYCKACASGIRRANRAIQFLKRWTSQHEDSCCRCGSKKDYGALWLMEYMIPLMICPGCTESYHSLASTPTLPAFVHWLRAKKCMRCGHEWQARSPRPYICPRCKSPRWERDDD